MRTENSDKDWLKEAPALTKISRANPFAVPSDYFESLNISVHTLIKLESFRFENEDEFDLPENYFNHLAERIEDRLALQNIQHLATAEGFKVPDSYFISLTERINSRIDEKSAPAKHKKLFPSWIRYSAAASIVFVIGISIYLNTSIYVFNQQLSKVPDQDIIYYLQLHSTVSDNQYIIENTIEDGLVQVSTDVSEEDIEKYIDNTTL